jgi:hypothetical protein
MPMYGFDAKLKYLPCTSSTYLDNNKLLTAAVNDVLFVTFWHPGYQCVGLAPSDASPPHWHRDTLLLIHQLTCQNVDQPIRWQNILILPSSWLILSPIP